MGDKEKQLFDAFMLTSFRDHELELGKYAPYPNPLHPHKGCIVKINNLYQLLVHTFKS